MGKTLCKVVREIGKDVYVFFVPSSYVVIVHKGDRQRGISTETRDYLKMVGLELLRLSAYASPMLTPYLNS